MFFLYLDPKPKRTIFIPIAQEVPQWTTKAQSSEHDARLVQAMSVDMNMTGCFFFFSLPAKVQPYNGDLLPFRGCENTIMRSPLGDCG